MTSTALVELDERGGQVEFLSGEDRLVLERVCHLVGQVVAHQTHGALDRRLAQRGPLDADSGERDDAAEVRVVGQQHLALVSQSRRAPCDLQAPPAGPRSRRGLSIRPTTFERSATEEKIACRLKTMRAMR